MSKIEPRAFSAEEYHRMAETGILSEKDRVELLQGEIVKMSPIGSRHAGCVNRLNALFNSLVGNAAIVSVQNPIHLDDYSEPQPDLALLKTRSDFYANSLPTAEDALLIVEVADTSEEYDRNVKLPLYAKAGVPETWLIILAEERVEVYSSPILGAYERVRQASRGDSLSVEGVAIESLSVDAILGV